MYVTKQNVNWYTIGVKRKDRNKGLDFDCDNREMQV